jgi:hypothetical protein
MEGGGRMRKTSILAAVLCLLVAGQSVWTQEVYKKKEVAVFNLSYYRWDIPPNLLGGLDEQIRSVFVNLGRFTVIGMTYRLGEQDISVFVQKIKQYKEENVEIPEQVQMGQEFFTQADMNALISSFIVVIPAVASYDVVINSKGIYTADISTSFTFVNVETTETIAQFFVKTSGTSKNFDDAVKSAIGSIPSSLTYEIKKVPEFQIKTGVLEVNGNEVVFELGRDTGISVGDEYEVLVSRVMASGKQVTESKGLLLVKRVEEEVSYATIVFTDEKLDMGDQLREIPRVGGESTVYARYIVLGGPEGRLPLILGIRQAVTRGFYDLRPFLELEFPAVSYVDPYSLPFNAALGGEYVLHLGKLQLMPRISAGVGFNIDFTDQDDPQFIICRYGGSAGVGASYLIGRDFRISAEAGYLYWYCADESVYGPTYGGVFAEAGISFRY